MTSVLLGSIGFFINAPKVLVILQSEANICTARALTSDGKLDNFSSLCSCHDMSQQPRMSEVMCSAAGNWVRMVFLMASGESGPELVKRVQGEFWFFKDAELDGMVAKPSWEVVILHPSLCRREQARHVQAARTKVVNKG